GLAAPLSAALLLTDRVPAGLAFVPGTLTATSGLVTETAPTLFWSGVLSPSPLVTITYAAAVVTDARKVIVNTATLFVPMLLYLIFAEVRGQGAFLHTDGVSTLLIVGAGVVTVVPLLMFASAVRLIPLSLIGIMQYIAPTLQFLIGVLIFGEAFTPTQFVGFGLVWLALIVFTSESFWARRQATMRLAEAKLLTKNE
ncbi:MAG: hypothetical protein HGB05_19305, partial [Chloroflexi bacterium]|nr:hypothetical protein [Chloroflexota bacterium]